MRTQDVNLKTCRRRWMIGRNGERGSGISALAARHDDDDDDDSANKWLMLNWIVSVACRYLKPFNCVQYNCRCWVAIHEDIWEHEIKGLIQNNVIRVRNAWNCSIVCNNYWYYIAMLETEWLCSNGLIMLKRIIGFTLLYLEPFDCIPKDEYCSIELLVLRSNTWDHLNVFQWMKSVEENCYCTAKPFGCIAMNE